MNASSLKRSLLRACSFKISALQGTIVPKRTTKKMKSARKKYRGCFSLAINSFQKDPESIQHWGCVHYKHQPLSATGYEQRLSLNTTQVVITQTKMILKGKKQQVMVKKPHNAILCCKQLAMLHRIHSENSLTLCSFITF